ncbi:MAG TPA: helicase-exonuclease AddAB subunit AddB [Lachnospiraceae bacterium]|nr:helicase-exonuclease AddAB subunit AddB [Lachnospiraceae bacterium]
MGLKLIFGNAGTGKSHTLYETVIRSAIESPEKNFLVLVPEQFTMQTQEDLVVMHPANGIMNIDVLSFHRLAYRIFSETGGGDKIVLDDEGKNLILRKIAGSYEKKLQVLGGNLKKPGYVSEMKSVISELTQYAISPKQLQELIEEIGAQSYLGKKLTDMQVMYEGFRAYLQEKYITGEELLDVLAAQVGQSAILKGSVIALDGFTGFTPVQLKLIGELLKVCEEILVTVTIDSREDPYLYRHPYQLFALSKQMTAGLVRTAKEAGVQVETPVYPAGRERQGRDSVPWRFRQRADLAFLEQNLFRYQTGTYTEEPEHIHIGCARSVKEECEYAAQQVRRLVRTKGYRYREISVITSNMEAYGDYLEKAFERYEIPLFLDHKRSVLLNSFVEYIRSLLDMVRRGFTADGVFRFLRTGLVTAGDVVFDADTVDELENYVLAWGIAGFSKWQQPFLRREQDMPQEALDRMNHLRAALVELLLPLVTVLRNPAKTIQDITEALNAFLVQERIEEQMQKQEQIFQECGELALAREYAQIYRIVQELLGKFTELLGEEKVSLKEYAELLDAGFNEAKVGVIPPGMDQVVAGDLKRTRLTNVRALFVLGLNDSWIPGKLEKNGLLSETDRERITRKGMTLAPGAKEEAYIQKFYLYINLTKPSDGLYLSYSQMTADGKSLRPAYLIAELKKLYPALKIEQEEGRSLLETEMLPQTGIRYLIDGMTGLEEGIDDEADEWEELLSWYLHSEEWQQTAEMLLRAGAYRKPEEHLEAETARQLYGDLSYTSVTRMEQFAACAFAHFLSYGLRLAERREHGFQALDWGNLLHRALERFSGKVRESGYTWITLPEEEQTRLIRESVEESITEYGNMALYSNARNEYLITRIVRMMQRTVWALTRQLEHGNFEPEGYEVNFRGGKIDRIDTYETDDTVYVKVMDYKTGMQSFDMTALYHGLQMQLVIYLDAALSLETRRHPGKEIVPAGIFYYRIKDPVVAREVDPQQLEEAILKELKLDGIVNSDEVVLRNLDREMEGTSFVIPAGRKKDGSLQKTSRTATTEEFRVLREYTRKKTDTMREQIEEGEIAITPYEMGTRTACDYCKFRHVCKFEPKLPGYAYRRLSRLSNDEAIARMKGEVR